MNENPSSPSGQQAGWPRSRDRSALWVVEVKNGKLLALAAAQFDVLLTIDSNLEYQQNLATLPMGVLVIQAVSNRLEHLEPVVPNILRELKNFPPRCLRRIAF